MRSAAHQKDPEELARIIAAADFLEMPALISASITALASHLQAKEWCFFYNAHPEKMGTLIEMLTPATQKSLGLLLSDYRDFNNAKQLTTQKIFSKRPRAILPHKDGNGVVILGKEKSFDLQKTALHISLGNDRSEKCVLYEARPGEKWTTNNTSTQMASLAFSRDDEPEVCVYNTSNTHVTTLEDLPNIVHRLAFAGPGDAIIVGSPQAIGLWNSTTGKQIHSVDISNYTSLLNCLATHQKSCIIALSIVASRTIHWYKSSEHELQHTDSSQPFEKVVSALAFNKQGTILAVGCYDETISLVCPTKKTILTTLPALSYIPHRICFSHQGTLFVLPKNNSGTVYLIAPKKLPLLKRIATTITEKLPASTVTEKIRLLTAE